MTENANLQNTNQQQNENKVVNKKENTTKETQKEENEVQKEENAEQGGATEEVKKEGSATEEVQKEENAETQITLEDAKKKLTELEENIQTLQTKITEKEEKISKSKEELENNIKLQNAIKETVDFNKATSETMASYVTNIKNNTDITTLDPDFMKAFNEMIEKKSIDLLKEGKDEASLEKDYKDNREKLQEAIKIINQVKEKVKDNHQINLENKDKKRFIQSISFINDVIKEDVKFFDMQIVNLEENIIKPQKEEIEKEENELNSVKETLTKLNEEAENFKKSIEEAEKTETTETTKSTSTKTKPFIIVGLILVAIAVIASLILIIDNSQSKNEEESKKIIRDNEDGLIDDISGLSIAEKADFTMKLDEITSLAKESESIQVDMQNEYKDFSIDVENKYVSADELSREVRDAIGAGEGTMVAMSDIAEYYINADKHESINELFPSGFSIQEKEIYNDSVKQTYNSFDEKLSNFTDNDTDKEFIKRDDLNEEIVKQLKLKPEEKHVDLERVRDLYLKEAGTSPTTEQQTVAMNKIFVDGKFDIYKDVNDIDAAVKYSYTKYENEAEQKAALVKAINDYNKNQEENESKLKENIGKRVNIYNDIRTTLSREADHPDNTKWLMSELKKERSGQATIDVLNEMTKESGRNPFPVGGDADLRMVYNLRQDNFPEVKASEIVKFDGKFYDTHKVDLSGFIDGIADVNKDLMSSAKILDEKYDAYNDFVSKPRIQIDGFKGGISTAGLTPAELDMTKGIYNTSDIMIELNVENAKGEMVKEVHSLQKILSDPEGKFEALKEQHPNFKGIKYGTMGKDGFESIDTKRFNPEAVGGIISNNFLVPADNLYSEYQEEHKNFVNTASQATNNVFEIANNLHKLSQERNLDDNVIQNIFSKLKTIETEVTESISKETNIAINNRSNSVLKSEFDDTKMTATKQDYLNKVATGSLVSGRPQHTTGSMTNSQTKGV